MNIEEAIEKINNYINCPFNKSLKPIELGLTEAIETILIAYEKEKEKNKNKDKILQNIREEFLKYDWKDANPIQTYNQIKNLYESIYCKPYED